MDRDAVVSDYTGNFGIRVDGYYGVGQWMYLILNGSVQYPVEEPDEKADAKTREEYFEKEMGCSIYDVLPDVGKTSLLTPKPWKPGNK